jgi:two-component system response regulator MprA
VHAPVLFLTARDSLTDRLSGFHSGGDDYLTKPFAITELIVRSHALLKRANAPGMQPAPATGLRMDAAAHAARNGDVSVSLTPTEFRLLAALAARPGVVLRRHELAAAAWPDGAIVHDNTLDAYVGRLRRKLRELETDAQITTARGVGYSLG